MPGAGRREAGNGERGTGNRPAGGSLTTLMDTVERLRDLVGEAAARVADAEESAQLDRLESELLGGDSEIAAARRSLRDADETTRREVGRAVNEAAGTLSSLLERRRQELRRIEVDGRLAADHLDITLPGRAPARGTSHLIHQVWDEIVDIFVAIGYTVAFGPEAETAYYNFDALNTPPTHPSRLESDTLYVEHGDDPEGVLLRTQTSPVQARWMESHPPPVYIVSPGRVYRRDALDATHSPVFHQMEGLAVDEDITFADLKGTLTHFMREFLGPGLTTRFLPHFFPFTEPSAEMHVSCFRCGGSGCRTCQQSGWIELLGCGVVDPEVLAAAGYDPDAVSGFAFGVGIDRLAMMRYEIPEIRYLFDPDVRVLEQFR
jgi:phenylalanyl-tRNA synthetase alpha chain